MYCKKFNLLFIHIPKTAGQSITQYFLELCGLEWGDYSKFFLLHNDDPLKGPPQIAHLTIDEYYKYDYIDNADIESAIKFSIVRNPWDRLWSEYRYAYEPRKISWNDFLKKIENNEIQDLYDKQEDWGRHILPQCRFIDDTVEIIHFENIEHEFKKFCLTHNIPFLGLPFRNRSKNTATYKLQYTEPQKAFVAEYYKDDIELFGYTFEN